MENKTQDVGQTRPRRWGSAGWAVAAKREGRWLILPGRYETKAGAELTAEFASLGGKCLVVEVSAGPDPSQRSEAEEPSEAVRCSELLGELEAALCMVEGWREDADEEAAPVYTAELSWLRNLIAKLVATERGHSPNIVLGDDIPKL